MAVLTPVGVSQQKSIKEVPSIIEYYEVPTTLERLTAAVSRRVGEIVAEQRDK